MDKMDKREGERGESESEMGRAGLFRYPYSCPASTCEPRIPSFIPLSSPKCPNANLQMRYMCQHHRLRHCRKTLILRALLKMNRWCLSWMPSYLCFHLLVCFLVKEEDKRESGTLGGWTG